MAKTNAERQRDYRQRRAAGQQPGPKCPGCRERDATMGRWKDRTGAVIRGLELKRDALEAEVERLTDALEAAREQAAGRSAPPCRSCGGKLLDLCPQCSRAGGWEDDF